MNVPNLRLLRAYGNEAVYQAKLAGVAPVLVKHAGLLCRAPSTPTYTDPSPSDEDSRLSYIAKCAAAFGMALADMEKDAALNNPMSIAANMAARVGKSAIQLGRKQTSSVFGAAGVPKVPGVTAPKVPKAPVGPTAAPMGGVQKGQGAKPTQATPKAPTQEPINTPAGAPAGAGPGTTGNAELPKPPGADAPFSPWKSISKYTKGAPTAALIGLGGWGAYRTVNHGLGVLGNESHGAPMWGAGYPALAHGSNRYGEAQLGTPFQY